MPEETRAPAAGAAPLERRRATRTGIVISSKMDKTVVVAVERRVSHARYSRVVGRTSKFYAHDERNACKPGDVVTIVESRPLSHLKRWRVRSVVREGRPLVEDAPEVAAVAGGDTGRPAVKRRQKPSAGGPAAVPGSEE